MPEENLPQIGVEQAEAEPKESWRDWYEKAVKEKGVEVLTVPLENNDWKPVRNEDGVVERFSHKDGMFFNVVGRLVRRKKTGGEFTQPSMEPVVDPDDPIGRQGIVVGFVDRETGDMLLGAEFETESKGKDHISIRPTIQASYSNIRSNGYPFSDLFVANNIPEFSERMVARGGIVRNEAIDPGRIGNYNLYGILPVDRKSIDLSGKPFHRWFSQSEIDEVRQQGDLVTNQFSAVNEMRLSWMMQGDGPKSWLPENPRETT